MFPVRAAEGSWWWSGSGASCAAACRWSGSVNPGGVDDAFVAFFGRHAPRLRAAVFAWSGDWHLADDVVQEVMVLVRHHWDRYDRLDVLMYRLARQQLSRYRRGPDGSGSRRRLPLDELPEGFEPAAVPPYRPDLETHLDLLDAVRRLPHRQREVIVLTELCDLDQATVGEILGISPSTVKTHKTRGLRSLQAWMAPRLAAAGEATGGSRPQPGCGTAGKAGPGLPGGGEPR